MTLPLRLLTLNICGPSMERGRLFEFLIGLDLDVLVLTETRPTPAPTGSCGATERPDTPSRAQPRLCRGSEVLRFCAESV